MKLAIIMATLTLTLTGCGTYGEPKLLAWWYDRNDPCQLKNNGGDYPSFCGAGSAGRTTIYTNRPYAPIGNPTGYVKK
jgi:hypothetical protein